MADITAVLLVQDYLAKIFLVVFRKAWKMFVGEPRLHLINK